MLPKKLQDKIDARAKDNSLRSLGLRQDLLDFSSNDYLGFSRSKKMYNKACSVLKQHNYQENGATGSRLLTANHPLYLDTEKQIAGFHNTASALIFNSGYDANIGFFSSVPQRGDVILYDALCHASIRDGIAMSHAKGHKFTHNNLQVLEALLEAQNTSSKTRPEIYVVTEAVFSMDGDSPALKAVASLCKKYSAYLIIDQAHATGVIGPKGKGLVQELVLEDLVFARIVTFGKALGCHGAAILGSCELKSYLINFARSFIYTTALPPHTLATIGAAYSELEHNSDAIKKLQNNISTLQKCILDAQLTPYFIPSQSAIHCCVIKGNKVTKDISALLQQNKFDVKAILSPTVPKGQERLRICLHSFNKKEDITALVRLLKELLIP
ncbi:pyridoxal phosphate-dependent aminotransferase family protein [Flavobacteriaceae bacterium]|nr:pyridoxal phosphate-dependent aminotransferase family protein [Flavobacteriaceae bacterium]